MGEKNRSNKNIKRIIISFFALFLMQSIFVINSVNVSAKTMKEKKPEMYVLTLQERGGSKEQINGVDIGLKYSLENPTVITFNADLLEKCINSLSCFDINKVIKSQDANVIYDGNSYIISNEIYGNEVNKNILYEHVVNAIKSGDTTINLDEINCYENPKFIANSPIVVYAKEALNKYLTSKITYNFAGLTQTLDWSIIKDWVWIDGNFQVILDETKVRNYVDTLANYYSTSLGTNIKVSGGYSGNNHSWIIDSSEETQVLIENIKSGQTIEKSPIYAQTSAAKYFKNVGDTYVEIDMAKQHLWYYKGGYLIVDGDIVTGNVSSGLSTPVGVYKLYYKQKDTVLKGEDYASPVSFWMPFNKGIGLHDASWRSEFGGEIYKTDGSHGCINAPYYVAKAVYDNINKGDIIICYN